MKAANFCHIVALGFLHPCVRIEIEMRLPRLVSWLQKCLWRKPLQTGGCHDSEFLGGGGGG